MVSRSSILKALQILCFLPLYAQGQGQIAFTCPPVPADPNLAKVTLLRLFYVGGSKAPSICLAREPKGQKPSIIETNLSAGTFSGYLAMRPERFKLHILDGKIPNDSTKPLPIDEKKLADPVDATLLGGSAHTILVNEVDGKITAAVIADPQPIPGATPVMRVLDLSGLGGWGIHLFTNKNQLVKTLWESGAATEGITIPNAGVYYVAVTRRSKDVLNKVGIFECQLSPGTACSVILLPGADKMGNASFVFDGTLGESYNAEAIKAIASGGGSAAVTQ